MQRPSARLDLLVVPASGRAVTSSRQLFQAWADAGVIDARGRPAEHAQSVVAGGFVLARVDDPGRRVLYANQQGGFRVACPACKANLVPQVAAVVRQLEHDPYPALACAQCGVETALNELLYAPPAAVGAGALVLADVGSSQLSSRALSDIQQHVGVARVIARRVSTG